MMMMESRRGRPKKDTKERKNHVYMLRLSDKEKEMLDYICIVKDEKSSDVLRRVLKMAYELVKNNALNV